MTAIIYKQDLKTNELFNLYDSITSEDKTTLLIYMKKINNVRKSIKLRICELIRGKKIENEFFEEDRSFILNNINSEHPHFIFTENGLEALKNVNDALLNEYVNDYILYLEHITSLC